MMQFGELISQYEMVVAEYPALFFNYLNVARVKLQQIPEKPSTSGQIRFHDPRLNESRAHLA